MSKAYKELTKVSGKTKLSVIIGILAVLICIGGGLIYYFFGRDQTLPEEHLADALIQRVEQSKGRIHSTLHMDDVSLGLSETDAEMLGEIFENIDLEVDLSYDTEAGQLEGNLNFTVMGTSLLKADYYLDDTFIMLNVPLLYDRPVYGAYKEIYTKLSHPMMIGNIVALMEENGINADMFKGSALEESTVDHTIKTLVATSNKNQYNAYLKLDRSLYRELLVTYLVDNLEEVQTIEKSKDSEGDAWVYGLSYNHRQTNYFMSDISGLMTEDPLIKALADEVSAQLFDQIIADKNAYLLGLLTDRYIDTWDGSATEAIANEARAQVASELLNRFEHLDKTTSDLMDQVYIRYGFDPEALIEQSDLNTQFYVNNEDQLTETNSDLHLDLSSITDKDHWIDMTINSRFYGAEDFEIIGFKEEACDNLGAMNLMEIVGFITEVSDNFDKNIRSNPMLSDLFHFDL